MRESAALLQWYVDAGVEEAIDATPRNYFATPKPEPEILNTVIPAKAGILAEQKKIPVSTGMTISSTKPTTMPIQHSLAVAIAEARRLADAATTLEELEKAVRGFEGCAIKRSATNTVFADGNPESKLMLIGEAPGAQEDAQGIPFCGPSGQLLDKMLAAIGYDRKSNAYITNTLFWRPPGNRQPNAEELAICQPFVEKHIALIDPQLLVLVGGTATKAVLGTQQGITKLRGKSYTYKTPYNDKEYPVAIVYHPSYLLRQPAQKRVTWQDLLAIKAKMNSTN